MSPETFVDTSGFYALLVEKDDRHVAARNLMQQASEQRTRFVTTDYVLDETATLLKARGHGYLLKPFFDTILRSQACRIEWTDSARFANTIAFFLKRLDQAWSFTDCLSFCLMRELSLQDAITKDIHFEQAGFTALLRG